MTELVVEGFTCLALLKFSFWATSSCEFFSFKSIMPSKEIAKLNVASTNKKAKLKNLICKMKIIVFFSVKENTHIKKV